MDYEIEMNNEILANIASRYKKLTEREQQVAELLKKDQTSKMISVNLGIEKSTVDSHRRNILKKLDIPDTSWLRLIKSS